MWFCVLGTLGVAFAGGCGPRAVPDRQPGVRAPLSARCDALDETRCLLPWPSSTYTIADPTSPTKLRLALHADALPFVDDPAPLNRDDGFSVVTPLAIGFDRPIAGVNGASLDGVRQSSAVHLILAQPDVPSHGVAVPVRLSVVKDNAGSQDHLLLAYPMRPLAYNSDYVAVVLDEVRGTDGSPLPVPRTVAIALGRAEPSTDEEAALRAYHAPTRALLAEAGVDAAHVIRVWDFTTRSAESVTAPLRSMRDRAIAAVKGGTTTVAVETATLLSDDRGIEVRGTLGGLPDFISTGVIAWDAAGLPTASGTRAARFRAIVPKGAPDTTYPFVLFGHGTGGSVNDNTFDDEILAAGAGKLNVEWLGWAGDNVLNTFIAFDTPLTGASHSTAKLMQALADGAALEAAIDGGPLATVLAAPTITPTMGDPITNLAAGRSADLDGLVYAGGSLGGTMGYVHALVDERVRAAVLNVPGAGWTHFVPPSLFWAQLRPLLSTPSDLDLAFGLAMTQNGWDAIDGGAWSAAGATEPRPFLLQESMGDPVLPNIGSDLLATSLGAVQVGAVLQPILDVSAVADSTASAITQFRVPPDTSAFNTHGFATEDQPAGRAARAQIASFLESVWAGAPHITVPDACAAQGGSCDFSTP